jgi:hypothetical protein
MKVDPPPLSFAERLDRFLRWFFTVSPTADTEPRAVYSPPRTAPAVSRREPLRPRAHHDGPVRVGARREQ